jgi:hypothetical protein
VPAGADDAGDLLLVDVDQAGRPALVGEARIHARLLGCGQLAVRTFAYSLITASS